MKNKLLYFVCIIIMEIGLLLQLFTLRRITMIVVVLSSIFLFDLVFLLIKSDIIFYSISFISGWYIANFIQWNFKEDVYDY